ncbi:hypothetical protein HMPREF0322_01892 [Desulfitobacterium hafniense DP7]|uniref:Uncharacterized protein n=1 Tax=Desulfitobacterium hafniense DP7 TaxID=537010 RepID=G9XLQ6_DESHA|nr:hypothetical protein [Desulfitobacterium hafniense]EHL07332.1 hypothetical protein HMPREF0322_01892 [Desulfitobacterium hafniense DP7]
MATLKELKERYQLAGLESEIEKYSIQTDISEYEQRSVLKVKIPIAREFKEITIVDKDNLLSVIADSQIENCKFIKGYEAIWSDCMNFIECEIDVAGIRITNRRIVIRKLARILGINHQEDGEDIIRIDLPSPKENVNISLGIASVEHTVLCAMQERIYLGPSPRNITLRIEGFNITTHDTAYKMLQKIGQAVLFQLDLITDLSLYTVAERKREKRVRAKTTNLPCEYTAPQFEYDSEPMSLYWYGRKSVEMPLQRFLAYYQALEFYFPIYSLRDAQNLIRNTIKDPRFSVNRDADIAGILSIIQISGGNKAFGDENSQLQAEILACLSINDLKDFFSMNGREDFFKSKIAKSLSEKLIVVSANEDIRIQVANRIYSIRCRVVHTKAAWEGQSLLLPFSPEERNLQHDLELLEFITRKVLIAGSRPLQL